MKRWKKILLAAAVVLVILVMAAWFSLDMIAKAAIEKGGTYALGVDTKVGSVSLHVFQGQAVVKGIVISNPKGCTTPHLMKTGSMEAAVQIGSLFTDTVVIDNFAVDGLDVNIEQPSLGKMNVTMLLDNIKAGSPAGTATGTAPSGKKYKVNHVSFKNVVAHIQLLPIPGKTGTFDVPIDEIKLDGVTSDNAAGIAMPELVRRLIPAILTAVVDKVKSAMPNIDLGEISGAIASTTQALGKGAANLVQQSGGEAAKLLQGLGGGAKDLTEKVKQGVGGLGNPLEGILGGRKKSDETQKTP
jgi:hypothetical protein